MKKYYWLILVIPLIYITGCLTPQPKSLSSLEAAVEMQKYFKENNTDPNVVALFWQIVGPSLYSQPSPSPELFTTTPHYHYSPPQQDFTMGFATSDNHSVIKPDGYGLGVHVNRFGSPVKLRPDWGYVEGEQLQIKTDAYGMGVHSDQYGRPVREYPWP